MRANVATGLSTPGQDRPRRLAEPQKAKYNLAYIPGGIMEAFDVPASAFTLSLHMAGSFQIMSNWRTLA